MAEVQQPVVWPRENYLEEWLALEDAVGGRSQMVGDYDVDVPTYNAMFAAISKQWPQHEDKLEVWDEETDETCNKTKVRIYKPKTADSASLPLMIFFHGGGLIAGNLDTEDAECRYFAANTPCIVISVDYPKVTDPSISMDMVIDQYAIPAVKWSKARAASLGADNSKTLLCGGSAGAMVSAQTAYHYAIDKKDSNTIAGVLLFYGCYFPYTYSDGDGKYKAMHKSFKEMGRGKVPMIHEDLAIKIIADWRVDFESRRTFPGLSDNLSGWPPTYLISAEKDVFRDDTKMFEQLLRDSGVPVEHDYYSGLPHWFHTFPTLKSAQTMMAKSVEAIKFVLSDKHKR